MINLAGEPIAGTAGPPRTNNRIDDSRVTPRAAGRRDCGGHRPAGGVRQRIGVSATTDRCGDEIVTEDSGAGHDFLAGVCRRWEARGAGCLLDRTRVVCVSTGLVLERDGGALPKMLPPFRLGAGGRSVAAGSTGPGSTGRTGSAWSGSRLERRRVAGPINATAPAPVTNADSRVPGTRAATAGVHAGPGFALRLLLGEMADALLLSGQRAVPAKAERLGFTFTYPTLAPALDADPAALTRVGRVGRVGRGGRVRQVGQVGQVGRVGRGGRVRWVRWVG